jgi:hypothetical protein
MSFIRAWWLLLLAGVALVVLYRLLWGAGLKLGWRMPRDAHFVGYLYFVVLGLTYLISLSLLAGFTMQGPGGVPNGPEILCRLNDWVYGLVMARCPEYYAAHPELAVSALSSPEYLYCGGSAWLKSLVDPAGEFLGLGFLAANPLHLFVGGLLLCTYPFWLYLGVRLGQLLVGSRPGKKGVLGLL